MKNCESGLLLTSGFRATFGESAVKETIGSIPRMTTNGFKVIMDDTDGNGVVDAATWEAYMRLVWQQMLVDQVVQPPWPRGADVHPRPLADRLKAFQHLNLLSAVGVLDLRSVAHAETLDPGNRVQNSR